VLLQVDPILLSAAIESTTKGLEMTGIVPVPVGASVLSTARHGMSVIVGLVGPSSGTVTMNFAEFGMLYLAGQLLGEPQTELNDDAIDAVMEIGNILAGALKDSLLNTERAVREISLPSLVVGANYSMVYARGITTVSVEFEIPGLSASRRFDRYFSTTISLMRRAGS
jgi:CheY-specific phosphatase CheX